jgi:hypothetical protein
LPEPEPQPEPEPGGVTFPAPGGGLRIPEPDGGIDGDLEKLLAEDE